MANTTARRIATYRLRSLSLCVLLLISLLDKETSSLVQVCFNESKTKLHWLEERVRLVMHHPALLG